MNLKINKFNIQTEPFRYALADFDVPFSYEELLDAIDIEPDSYKLRTNNTNFQKMEIRTSHTKGIIDDLLILMSSHELTKSLSAVFDIAPLTSDISYDGGGLTITDVGGHLHYHADFPYSNKVKKYRVINCLLYLSSPNIKGGDLHLLDPSTRTVEASVQPLWGRVIAFPTTRHTPHGFSKVKEGRRISVNAYFYADHPLDERYSPSKTEWL